MASIINTLCAMLFALVQIAQAHEVHQRPFELASLFSEKFPGMTLCIAIVNQESNNSSQALAISIPDEAMASTSPDSFITIITSANDGASGYVATDRRFWLFEVNQVRDVDSPLSSELRLSQPSIETSDPIRGLASVEGGVFIPMFFSPILRGFIYYNGQTVRQVLLEVASVRKTGWIFESHRIMFTSTPAEVVDGAITRSVTILQSTTSLRFLDQIHSEPSSEQVSP